MAIPANVRKVTIFYEYKASGFSETLYTSNSMVSIPNMVSEYLKLRLAFADDQMVATYARMSDGNFPRRADFLDLKDTPGMSGLIVENGCSPTDVVLLALQTSTFARRPFFVHAFPARFLKEDVVVPNGKWFDLLKAWGDYLGTSEWRILSTTGNELANRKLIASAAPQLPRGCQMTMVDAPVVVAGDTVLVSNTSKNGVGYGGRKTVLSVDIPTKHVLLGGASPVGDLGNAATLCKLTPSVNAIAKIKPVKLGKRNVGRPSRLPVGRQAATLSLRR